MPQDVIEKMINFDFPFEYKGGGYFRDKNIAKGEPAEVLHGSEVVKYIREKLVEIVKENQ